MPPNFLANLGTGLRNFGGFLSPEFETGARLGSGLRDRFKRRPGEPGEVETENFPSLPVSSPTSSTPINPAIATDTLENSVADGEAAARSKLPINRLDIGVPPLSPAPSMAEIRSPLPSLPARRDLPINALAAPPAAAGMEASKPEMDLDRRNVPIPRLPGHAGGPRPYNTIEAAGYDSVMKHHVRDAEGNLKPKSEGGGFKRDWKMALRNAMLGAGAALSRGGGIESAIGGALAGGVGSYFNPQAGHEFAFDYGERPRMEAEMARTRADQDRANLEIFNRAKREGMEAETDWRRSEAEKNRRPEAPRPVAAQMKLGRNRKTGQTSYFNALDSAENAAYEPIPDASPIGSSPQGLYDTRTGQVVTPAPEKPREAPRGMLDDLNDVEELKREAEKLWQSWGSPTLGEGEQDTPEAKERRRQKASAAQEGYNRAAERIGAVYGDWFETGPGEGGWHFVKPRQKARTQAGGQAPQRSGTGITRPRSQFNSSKFPGIKFDD